MKLDVTTKLTCPFPKTDEVIEQFTELDKNEVVELIYDSERLDSTGILYLLTLYRACAKLGLKCKFKVSARSMKILKVVNLAEMLNAEEI